MSAVEKTSSRKKEKSFFGFICLSKFSKSKIRERVLHFYTRTSTRIFLHLTSLDTNNLIMNKVGGEYKQIKRELKNN